MIIGIRYVILILDQARFFERVAPTNPILAIPVGTLYFSLRFESFPTKCGATVLSSGAANFPENVFLFHAQSFSLEGALPLDSIGGILNKARSSSRVSCWPIIS